MLSLTCRLTTVPTCPSSDIEHKFASSNLKNLRLCLASDPTLVAPAPMPEVFAFALAFAPMLCGFASQHPQFTTPKSAHVLSEPTWLEYLLVRTVLWDRGCS